MRNREPVHRNAVDLGGARFEHVRPVDIRRGAGGGDFDVVPALRHALGHLPAVLLGAAGNHLTVTLDHVADAHHTTSRSTSSTIASDEAASSAADAAPAPGDEIGRELGPQQHFPDRFREERRSLGRGHEQTRVGHCLGDRCARARDHRGVERHRFDERDTETFVFAGTHHN